MGKYLILTSCLLVGCVESTDDISSTTSPPETNPSSTSNLIVNGSFESGQSSWSFSALYGAVAGSWVTSATSVSGGHAEDIWVSHAACAWCAQLTQAGLHLQNGQPVTITFSAKANYNRPLEFGIQQVGGAWVWHGIENVNLTKSWHQYSYTFTMTADDSNAALRFDTGNYPGEIWLDAVSVTTSSGSTAASCTFDGQTIASGGSVTAYQSASVPAGSSCVSQTRTCSNGTLSGSYGYASCSVDSSGAVDAIVAQNTPGGSTVFPSGVPTSYSWYTGKDGCVGSCDSPSGFTAITGWGQIYPQAGATNVSCHVFLLGFKTFVHLKSGSWVLVQDEASDSISGAHYVADFSNNGSYAWSQQNLPDGSTQVDSPVTGYNDHFYYQDRGTYGDSTVDGVFVEARIKTDNDSANLIANLGADWWRDATAPFLYQNGVFVNNPGVGMSNWVKLTTTYQYVYYTTLTPQMLQSIPPPF